MQQKQDLLRSLPILVSLMMIFVITRGQNSDPPPIVEIADSSVFNDSTQIVELNAEKEPFNPPPGPYVQIDKPIKMVFTDWNEHGELIITIQFNIVDDFRGISTIPIKDFSPLAVSGNVTFQDEEKPRKFTSSGFSGNIESGINFLINPNTYNSQAAPRQALYYENSWVASINVAYEYQELLIENWVQDSTFSFSISSCKEAIRELDSIHIENVELRQPSNFAEDLFELHFQTSASNFVLDSVHGYSNKSLVLTSKRDHLDICTGMKRKYILQTKNQQRIANGEIVFFHVFGHVSGSSKKFEERLKIIVNADPSIRIGSLFINGESALDRRISLKNRNYMEIKGDLRFDEKQIDSENVNITLTLTNGKGKFADKKHFSFHPTKGTINYKLKTKDLEDGNYEMVISGAALQAGTGKKILIEETIVSFQIERDNCVRILNTRIMDSRIDIRFSLEDYVADQRVRVAINKGSSYFPTFNVGKGDFELSIDNPVTDTQVADSVEFTFFVDEKQIFAWELKTFPQKKLQEAVEREVESALENVSISKVKKVINKDPQIINDLNEKIIPGILEELGPLTQEENEELSKRLAMILDFTLRRFLDEASNGLSQKGSVFWEKFGETFSTLFGDALSKLLGLALTVA